MCTSASQEIDGWGDFDQSDRSCSIGAPRDMHYESEKMKKSGTKIAKSASAGDDGNAKNAVITVQDVQIMSLIGRNSLTTSDIHTALLPEAKPGVVPDPSKNATLGNMLNKLTRMANKGFLQDVHKDDEYRTGLREGEQRRYWKVTPLGREAMSIHGKMIAVQTDSETPKIQSRRLAKPVRKKKAVVKKKVVKKARQKTVGKVKKTGGKGKKSVAG